MKLWVTIFHQLKRLSWVRTEAADKASFDLGTVTFGLEI
jgi:hypothetical protein